MTRLLFSVFDVTTQAFYKAKHSFAIVNLKPIVPGHVLVVPQRSVPRLADLDDNELTCLMRSINHVGSVVQRVYGSDGLTIACQDGKAAGQSVPHVHFHILPRKFQGDPFAGKNDEIYPALEENEASIPANLKHEPLRVDADDDRKHRGLPEMEQEANWLKGYFEQSQS